MNFLKILLPVMITTGGLRMQCSIKSIPDRFRLDIENNVPIQIISLNDYGTDPDSTMADITLLACLSEIKSKKIKVALGATDDFDFSTVTSVLSRIRPDENDEWVNFCRSQTYSAGQFIGYRTQDAACLFFPLAIGLGLSITVFQGNIVTEPGHINTLEGAHGTYQQKNTLNPYMGYCGAFGKEYKSDPVCQDYLSKLYPTAGVKAFIAIIEQARNEHRSLYVLNGGSLRLLTLLAQERPDLASAINLVMMVFKQPMPFMPHLIEFPSHNESIDFRAAQEFFYLSTRFKAIEMLDSNTVHYAPVCGSDLPAYKDFLKTMKLDKMIPKLAFKNLIQVFRQHGCWSGYGDPKFMDSAMVAHLFGDAQVPMKYSSWKRIGDYRHNDGWKFGYAVVPDDAFSDQSLYGALPWFDYPETIYHHPYSSPAGDNSYYAHQNKANIIYKNALVTFMMKCSNVLAHATDGLSHVTCS